MTPLISSREDFRKFSEKSIDKQVDFIDNQTENLKYI